MNFRKISFALSLTFIMLLGMKNTSLAQSETVIPATDEWEPGGILLDNSDLTVEIEFKLAKKGCDSSAFGNSNHLFRYKILAKKKPLNEDRYLTFKIIYQDCFGRYICKTNNLNIGIKKKNDVWDGIQPLSDPNLDNSFRGSRLIIPFSEVKLNWTKDPTKDSECYKKVVSIPSAGSRKKNTTTVTSQTTDENKNSEVEDKIEKQNYTSPRQEPIKSEISKSYPTRKADLRIKGPSGQIIRGQKIRLELTDPTDTEWNWYEEKCDGILVKSASSFYETEASISTTYYAKPIVNNSNKEICLNYHLFVDSVSTISFPAKKIIATKNGRVCPGEAIKMYPMGGLLGTGAVWQWFSGKSCSGNSFFEGDTLIVEALPSSFSFSVLAKGTFNTTECISKDLNVINPNAESRSIISNPAAEDICPGSEVILSIAGKALENEPNWKWYSNQNTFLGEGISLKYKVNYSTGINAKLEGICNEPITLYKDLYVTKTSIAPSKYKIRFLPANNLQISIKDGELLGQSKWVWYKNYISKENRILVASDTYETIYDPNLTLFVRAEGPCDTTQTLRIDSLSTRKSRSYFSIGYTPMNISGTQTSNSFSITFGRITNLFGWYIRGKYAPSDVASTTLTTNNTEITNYNVSNCYYQYNGSTKTTRYSALLGLNIGFSKQFFWNIGAGYGSRELYWGINEFSIVGGIKSGTNYAKNTNFSQTGIEIETGFTLSVSKINLGASFNYLGLLQNNNQVKPFSDTSIHLGFNF
jgi:hypothetical protein